MLNYAYFIKQFLMPAIAIVDINNLVRLIAVIKKKNYTQNSLKNLPIKISRNISSTEISLTPSLKKQKNHSIKNGTSYINIISNKHGLL